MAVSAGFAEHVRELLGELGPIRIKNMFGGAGVYCDDLIFALIIEDALWIKADAENRTLFEAAGSEPFTFEYKDGRRETMNYWRLPDTASDAPEEALRWARLGLDAALRARRPKTKKAAPLAELGPGPWVED